LRAYRGYSHAAFHCRFVEPFEKPDADVFYRASWFIKLKADLIAKPAAIFENAMTIGAQEFHVDLALAALQMSLEEDISGIAPGRQFVRSAGKMLDQNVAFETREAAAAGTPSVVSDTTRERANRIPARRVRQFVQHQRIGTV
jgi:hypothetical protein